MIFTPFSCVLLRIFITLLLLWLGLVVPRVSIFSLSLSMRIGVCLSLLLLWWVCRSKLAPLLPKFFLDLDNISISHTQWGDVHKLHFYLNASMQITAVFEHHMSLWVFDTHFGVQGMENICEIWYFMVPFWMHGGPSGVLVLVASNRVVLFFNGILEGTSYMWNQKYYRLLYGPLLRVSAPLVLNMGDRLEECKSNFFPIEKIVDRKNTLPEDSTIYLQNLHLSVLQIMEYLNLIIPWRGLHGFLMKMLLLWEIVEGSA